VLENKKYTWENSRIIFLPDGRMDGFGTGKYIFEDVNSASKNNSFSIGSTIIVNDGFKAVTIVHALFGGKVHSILFNSDFTHFTSNRRGDNNLVEGILLPDI
jgi:hypothetical protein